ncbi:MAG: AMP-binding protein [Acidobacteria bacterium]|nr:AMP-binding protein [Acidobacteriota bacterium]
MADWFEKRTLGGLLDDAVRRFASREALCFEDRRWTFAQFQSDVDRTAQALIHQGVRPGDKVSLWMTNRPEWLQILFAVAKIGAVLVPINTRFRTADVEYVLHQSDSTTLITQDRSGPVNYLEMVEEICPEIASSPSSSGSLRAEKFPELRRILVLGDDQRVGTHSWADVMASAGEVPQSELEQRQRAVSPDDTVLLMYTSGTTGFPKGVMHSHNIQRTLVDTANRMGVTARDVILMYLPLFHAFGLYEGPILSLVSGARMVLMPGFDAGEALRMIEREHATVLNGFDTHFFDLTRHPNRAATDLSSLRTALFAAGMASSEPVARRAQRDLCPTITGYGMTEVGVGAALSFLDSSEDDRCLTSGYPLPGYEFKVIDPETGETQPPDTLGELCVRGYALMQGYYQKPEETADAIDAEGWFHTGDVATLRDDECLRFFGRYKDLLKVGGENVDPAEVEGFLLGHPAIELAQVVGVPDPRLSEVACACVVLKPGQEATAEELMEHVAGHVAHFKQIRHVEFINEIPRSLAGKILRRVLRDREAAGA